MKKRWVFIIIIAVSIVTSFISTNYFLSNSRKSEDRLTKVLNKGEIRVGYVIYPPGMIKDPNTGKLSGIFHDTLARAGKNLGLKINS